MRALSTSALLVWLGVVHVSGQAPASGPLPMLPLTQLDERPRSPDLDNRRFTLTFGQPVPIRDLLLLLVRGTDLSIVPEPPLEGLFIGELKDVTVRQALDLALPPLGLEYAVDGSFVRVFRTTAETRMFDLNYLSIARIGRTTVGGTDDGSGLARVDTTTAGDFFADLELGVQTLLSDRGLVHVDRKAGILQVTDVPDRIDRIGLYLEAVHERVHRQVQIDARIVEVELSDPEAETIDWNALADASGAGVAAQASARGLRVKDQARFLAALSSQGRVSILASPQVIAMNNELAVMRGHTETSDRRDDRVLSGQTVTLGVVPQISADGMVMLSISPIVIMSASGTDNDSSIERAIRATDTLARVAAGETVVISGFARKRSERLGGGFLRRSTTVTRRVELLVLLTSTVIEPRGGD